MSDYYELIGQTAVPVGDVLDWARKFETMDVSTVFLGLDYSRGGGPPLLFETMAFWHGAHGYEQERCSSWLQAQEQHARMCAEVALPGSVILYIGRCFQDWRYRAGRDLGRRWRELRGVELSDDDKLLDSIEARTFGREDW
jgi:hypothetical protein